MGEGYTEKNNTKLRFSDIKKKKVILSLYKEYY